MQPLTHAGYKLHPLNIAVSAGMTLFDVVDVSLVTSCQGPGESGLGTRLLPGDIVLKHKSCSQQLLQLKGYASVQEHLEFFQRCILGEIGTVSSWEVGEAAGFPLFSKNPPVNRRKLSQ